MDRNIIPAAGRAAARVVPYVGTWIEILPQFLQCVEKTVVPYVGTWIEIYNKEL